MITRDNYELVYEELLRALADVDLSNLSADLGAVYQGDHLEIQFLGQSYRISNQGIWKVDAKEPNVSVRIILCHYLLQAGQGKLTGEWLSYRDFKDSAFFISNFQANVEERIAQYFAGRASDLEEAAQDLDGEPYEGFQTGDVCYYFQALPKVPLLLVFYDKDADFPASCKVLFDKSAPTWLDMECLAVLGWILAGSLMRISHRLTPVE
jgi:hypothetical protein